MKKFICCFIALLSLGHISWAYNFSYTYQGQTLCYNIVGDHAQVTHQNSWGYSNLTGALVIPDSVTYGNTYPVTSIGADAFRSCAGLTSVTIPEGVTSIGAKAFSFCTGLTSVSIPAGVSYIGDEAFYHCSNLTTFNIPVSVTYIGDRAFSSCESLVTVSIPNGMYHIGDQAFRNCSALTSIIIPDGIAFIGDNVLLECTSLINAVYNNSCFIFLPPSYSGSYTIPSGITKICGGAFYGCNNLTSVTFPTSINSIGKSAFGECHGLTTLVIPDCVSTIGNSAFFNVRHVEYHGSATGSPWDAISVNGVVDGDFVFTDYSKHYLEAYLGIGGSATIPSTVDTIGNKAFYACRELNSVIIPNGVASIGNSVFYYCTNLTNISIPNSVNSIGSYAFQNCTGMASISIPDGVTSINSYAFYHVRHIEYHGNATGSPWGAISMNGVVDDNFVFPDSTKHYLLAYIGNEDTVVIPSTVDSIGDWAFYGCTAMVSVFIPTSVTSIGAWSFYGCDSLKVVQMNPMTPPSLGNINSLSDRTIDIVVPHTFYAAYTNAGDNYSRHRIYRDTVFVTVNSNDTNRGYVYGYNSVYPYPLYLDTITLTAIPNYGYHFARWEDYTTDNIRILSGVMQDIVLTAYFDYNQYTIMLSVDTSIHGTVSGTGSYNYLSELTITANSNYGYHFTVWNDGDTTNPRTITLTQDTVFTALFAKNSYNVTVVSADTIQGNVVGSTTTEYLDTVSIAATANYGYHFLHWNDGDTTNPRVITLMRDTLLTAYFTKNWYSVIGISDNETMGYVTGSDTVEYLDSVSLSATSNYGYHFTSWNDGDTNNPRVVCLTQDTSFVALFAKNQYALTVQSNDETQGSVSNGGVFDYLDTVTIIASASEHYHFVRWDEGNTDNPREYVVVNNATLMAIFAIDTHTVSVATNDILHGCVDGGSEYEYGSPCTVTATAYSGYRFVQWSNGSTYNPYTFAVTTDIELTAMFIEEGSIYNITATSADPSMGTVTGGGPYGVGEEATLTAVPFDGYLFDRWDDGNTLNPRTITVTSDATYIAYFVATQSIDDVIADAVNVYTLGGQIVVETNQKDEISIYDIVGRKVDGGRKTRFDVPASGVYLVKIGTSPTQKVVVVK